MDFQSFLAGIICIIIALVVMFRLMHYARFYVPAYFFWIGAIFIVVGIISLIFPLKFLFILNRTIASFVAFGGALISAVSLLWPVKTKHSPTNNQKIDELLPDYAFNEFHEVHINNSPEKVKQTLQVTGVKDIPAAHLLMKIRGIADDDLDMSDRAANNIACPDTFSTPDFNFFRVAPDEYITVMVLKSSIITNKSSIPAPPEILSLEQFMAFNKPGYVKVAVNFRFISSDNNETILTTETRNKGITHKDNRTFGRYWRIIYPGSAIIRRVWLDTIKKRAEKL
jgi:hypothetical protein